uniref:Uncharacterized protein n=1 Tax=Candidatus Berkiella aquae TaxID=295108 RepID=A0A0Q9YIB5_9GAMM
MSFLFLPLKGNFLAAASFLAAVAATFASPLCKHETALAVNVGMGDNKLIIYLIAVAMQQMIIKKKCFLISATKHHVLFTALFYLLINFFFIFIIPSNIEVEICLGKEEGSIVDTLSITLSTLSNISSNIA